MNKEVTIVTVTKRDGWWVRQLEQYKAQTIHPKWVIVAEPYTKPRNLQDIDQWADVVKAPKKVRKSNLSRSDNEGLRHVETPYVIFWQDFIDLDSDTLEKLLKDAKETGGFVSTACIDPDGNYDARYLGTDMLRPCMPEEWETNVAIAPMEAIRKLGGFDEEYDQGWAWDNVNVAERAAMLGYEFFLDESINPRLLYHPKEPDLDSSLKPNGEFHAERMRQIRDREFPIKLPYL
jgi:hypothetical protein